MYRKSYRKLPKKQIGLKNKFSRFAGYKVKIQKSEDSLYTGNEKSKNEIRKTTRFKRMSKTTNYHGRALKT